MVPPVPRVEAQPDPLTHLPTRPELLRRLGDALVAVHGPVDSVAALYVDIDGFRPINRERGHGIGDQLLFSAARRIVSAAGSADLVARAGGDEFVVISSGLEAPGGFAELGKRILAAFVDPFELGGHEFSATVSIGAAVTADPATRPEALVADAEAALERAAPGCSRFEVFDAELRELLRTRAALSRDLGSALGSGEVELAYQPIVDIASGRIVSIEALARWRHAERGPISPELFVAVAQEAGLGEQLFHYLMSRAAEDFARLSREDPTGRVSLAVNVSAADLGSPSLVDEVGSLIASCGVAPERIVIEISESALSGAPDAYLARVSALRDVGVRISLDDFGTASTSISQLRSLPIDQIKLDRCFVSGLGTDSPDAALAAGLLPIARALGIEVVAEGIETDQQLAHLFALGYRLGQGYRFAVATWPEEIAGLIASGPLAAARASDSEPGAAARESFRRALLAGDARRAASVVSGALRAGMGAMTIQTEVIGRALHWIDSEWEAGRLRAADEHLAAAICERQLAVVIEATERPARPFAPRVLLASLGEESRRGELSSAAEALDSAGYETVSLGADVDTDVLEAAAGAHRPGAICLNVPGAQRGAELREALERLGAIDEPPLVLVGGAGDGEAAAPRSGVIAVASNEDAVDVLARRLSGRGSDAASA